MYCRRCGKQLDDEWSSCPYCGELVENKQSDSSGLTEKHTKQIMFYKKWWFWLIIIVVIVGIIVVSMVSSSHRTEEQKGSVEQIEESIDDFSDQDFKDLIGKSKEDVEAAGLLRDNESDKYIGLDGDIEVTLKDNVVDQIIISGQPDTSPLFYSVKIGMSEEEAKDKLNKFYPEDTSSEGTVNVFNFDTKGSVECSLSEGIVSGIYYKLLSDEEISALQQQKEEKLRAEYIFPDSNTRYLSEDEIRSVDTETMNLGRNEIFARHGYIFSDSSIQGYFESRPWYKGTVSGEEFNADEEFNDFEKKNVELIKQIEDEVNGTDGEFIGMSGIYICTDSDVGFTGRIEIYRTGDTCDFVLNTLDLEYDLLTGIATIIDDHTIQITSYGVTITCTWSDAEHMYVTTSEIVEGTDAAVYDDTTNGRNYIYADEFN